ncbi:cytochrome ubiquinol oxidase subunit I, partial [Paraburkholderia sp. BR10937]
LLALWTAYALHKARGNLERLLAQRKLLLAWVLCIPLPYVAVEAGWIVREVGRQPWVVYGLLRTSQAVSAVPASSVTASMAMFFVFDVVLLITFFLLARRWLMNGPDLTATPPAITSITPRTVGAEY